MSPRDRALCKPSGKYKHHDDDHGDDDDDDHAAWERFERDLRASWCRPAEARATAQANYSLWQR
jgi:hypothetical protein